MFSAIYTGRDSKIAMNARQTPSKLSSVEDTINSLIYLIFGVQIVLSAISLVAYIIFKEANYDDLYYLCYDYSDSPIALYKFLLFLLSLLISSCFCML